MPKYVGASWKPKGHFGVVTVTVVGPGEITPTGSSPRRNESGTVLVAPATSPGKTLTARRNGSVGEVASFQAAFSSYFPRQPRHGLPTAFIRGK